MTSSLDTSIRGSGRRGPAVRAAALVLILAALSYSSPPASGAGDPKPRRAAAAQKQPKVEGRIRRGQLDVAGTAASERIAVRLKPGDRSRLQVDVGANGRPEFTFRRSAFNRVVVHGGGGADALSVDERFGVFANTEATSLFGDAGNDLLRGGGAAERLFGGTGDDRVDGKRGRDVVEGGTGADVVLFDGSDAAERFTFSANGGRLRFLAASTVDIAAVERFDLRALRGNDDVVVRDLAGSGLGRLDVDTGAGLDRLVVEGTSGADAIGAAASTVAPHVLVSGGAGGVAIDVVNGETLALESLAGSDTVNGAAGLAALVQLTLDGGAGSDALNGGDGNDVLLGGSENDTIDGNGGADLALLGGGDDSFVWDPGDGSDRLEGEAGGDTMVFNGAGVAESFDLSGNGNRLRLFRTQGAIAMDTAGVERVDLRTLGGSDTTVVNDLSATDVRNVELDHELAIGGGAGDGAVDSTTINGTGGNDAVAIAANAGAIEVTGPAAAVKIEHSEAANDLLHVNGLGGNDRISASPGTAALLKLSVDGGAGNDTVAGGDGAESLLGGDGDDLIDGNGGADTGVLGSGDDVFVWDPGDGSDVVEGGDGGDTMRFNGAAAAESFDVSANGPRLRFFRAQGAITMDLSDTEFVDVQALGGADTAVVNDLRGTDIKVVAFDLEAAVGGDAGDGAADSITVNGTDGDDDIQIAAGAGTVGVFGIVPTVQVEHSEPAGDTLALNSLGGDDTIAPDRGVTELIRLLIDGIPFLSQPTRPQGVTG